MVKLVESGSINDGIVVTTEIYPGDVEILSLVFDSYITPLESNFFVFTRCRAQRSNH